MAQLVVRNVEDEVQRRLQERAALHGRSLEDEVRAILREAVGADPEEEFGLGTHIANLFEGIGLESASEIPELRGYPVRPATFDE